MEFLEQLLNKFNKSKSYLLIANILLVFFLILLSNLGVLPIKDTGDFLFFLILALLFSLYRPGWSFLLFIGTIALDNINLAPESLGISVRPYQFFAGITIIAILTRLAVRRLNFKLPKIIWIDWIVVIFATSGFISSLLAIDKSLAFKNSIIAASFVAVYFLARVFIQNLDDLKKIIPFFLISSVLIVIYGIWQNIRFTHGLEGFEAMPGRPNATFTEPDWLGIYLVLLIAVLYSLVYYFNKENEDSSSQISNFKFQISNKILNYKYQILNFLFLTLSFSLLIITVSRSAWLGVAAVTVSFLIMTLIKDRQWNKFFKRLGFIATAIIISIGLVYVFNLTSFQLFNRVQSTGTGLQKITVSCALTDCEQMDCIDQKELKPGSIINSINDLDKYNCRHINLEDMQKEKALGNEIVEVYRTDPNVNIRSQIYQKSWNQIKNHTIFGLGWGNIGEILGKDERGSSLNSSNIFFETWLGAGIVGLVALMAIWVYILTTSIKLFRKSSLGESSFGLFLFLGTVSLLIPNLFNAGIFMGILWLFFGINISNHKA
jgi:O-antigen ligase